MRVKVLIVRQSEEVSVPLILSSVYLEPTVEDLIEMAKGKKLGELRFARIIEDHLIERFEVSS